jgi:hypothetical protein
MNKTIAVAGAVTAALFISAGFLCAYPEADGIRRAATCDLQGWPNYDIDCVRDDRQRNGVARQVRVVPIDTAPVSFAAR